MSNTTLDTPDSFFQPFYNISIQISALTNIIGLGQKYLSLNDGEQDGIRLLPMEAEQVLLIVSYNEQ